MKRATLAGALSALAFAASAQSRLPPGVDGGRGAQATATRSVSHYLDLERSLAEALREHRRDDVLRMLAADFELRSAASLDAIAGSDWLAAQMRSAPAPARVRDLAVRELGDLATVSFLLDSSRRGQRSTFYVVDVWQQTESKLAIRYVSEPMRALPAAARPRGRE